MAIYSAEHAAAQGQDSGIAESLITSYHKQPYSEGWQDDGQSTGPERRQCHTTALPVQELSPPLGCVCSYLSARHTRDREGITLAALTSLQAFSKPKPC